MNRSDLKGASERANKTMKNSRRQKRVLITWSWIKAVNKTNSFKSFKSGERKFSVGKVYSEQREAEAKSRYSIKHG